jgi:predicted AAA+ superfamily ATPase
MVVLQSKGASKTIASIGDAFYVPQEVYEWMIGRKYFDPNPTIPFYSIGKIGIRMAIGNEHAFEELHSIQSTEEYLFPTLVTKALEKKCTQQFIQTVCMATLTQIKDRFPSWKLMQQALEKGVAVELLRRGNHPKYWKSQHHEIDFYTGEEIIQVCVDLTDAQTRKREFLGLVNAANALAHSRLVIITKEKTRTETFEWFGKTHMVHVTNIDEFLTKP